MHILEYHIDLFWNGNSWKNMVYGLGQSEMWTQPCYVLLQDTCNLFLAKPLLSVYNISHCIVNYNLTQSTSEKANMF